MFLFDVAPMSIDILTNYSTCMLIVDHCVTYKSHVGQEPCGPKAMIFSAMPEPMTMS